jgi:hypothetical protein
MSAPTVIAINDRRIRVRVDGSPEQPAILLLHGVGSSTVSAPRRRDDKQKLCVTEE